MFMLILGVFLGITTVLLFNIGELLGKLVLKIFQLLKLIGMKIYEGCYEHKNGG